MSGILYGLTLRITNFLVFFLLVTLIPGIPPKTTFPFKEFSSTGPRELKGSLELNSYLDGAERLLDQRVYGPECLIGRKNEIYTGIHGGEVIKITGEHVVHVAKFGYPCEGIFEESRCGRPLGLAFDTLGNNLIVADAYFGIWEVELSQGKKKQLISPHQIFDGKVQRKAKIFNSVAVDKSGDIYWTDSSSDFSIEDGVMTIFANPSGRLFHYNRKQNVSKALMDELFFPNGLALSPEEDFIIVAETGAARLLKYHIKGPKKGQHEVFVDGLPGQPDNLTPDPEGLWIPLVVSLDSEHPSMYSVFSNFPRIRLFISRILALLEIPFRLVNNAFPNTFSQKYLHLVGHFESVRFLLPKRTTIVRVDWSGHILGSLHGFDKSAGAVSHVLEVGEHLYLGSPFNRFVGKVKSPLKSKPQIKVQNIKYESALPKEKTVTAKPTTTSTTTTKPRPTTTTPKPTTTTTTPKPTTTTPKPTTTTPKPTSTTTPRPPSTPKPTTTTSTTQKPTTTTAAPTKKATQTTTPKPTAKPKDPAPIKENIPKDTPLPKQEKLKVIKKGGQQGEL